MKRPISLLLMASCLSGCGIDPSGRLEPRPLPIPMDYVCEPYDPRSAISTAPPDAGELMFHADLPKGSLVCGYWDGIHRPPEPLQRGHGQVDGSEPAWTPSGDALQLAVTAPGTIPADKTPSAGVFSTNLDFGPRTAFSAHATFQRPETSLLDPQARAWAAGAVTVRTGETDDLKAEARLSATVRVNGTKAILNVTEVGRNNANPSRRADPKEILGELKANIFERYVPYTIGLTVNRRTGLGMATLSSGSAPPLQMPFELSIFTPVSDLKITAVGAAVVNCCVPDARVTVLLSDFRISKPGRWPNLPVEPEPNVPREVPPPTDPH